MTIHSRRIFGLATAFLLVGGAAGAQGNGQDKEKGKGQEKGKSAKAVRGDRDTQGRVVIRDRDRDGRVIIRARDRDGRVIIRDDRDGRAVRGNGTKVPPGLAKKPGGMPPGQYKKRYSTVEGSSVLRDILLGRGYTVVRTENAGANQYVFYRLRDGSVQRAVVSSGDDRLVFGNVPDALLREVLSRLY